MKFETENIEFKSQATDELYKEVIAFANTDGGTVFVGIDNDGNVTGLDNVDEVYTRITQTAAAFLKNSRFTKIAGITDNVVPAFLRRKDQTVFSAAFRAYTPSDRKNS